MNPNCGYAGDMEWLKEEDGDNYAICPSCGEECSYESMANDEDEWRQMISRLLHPQVPHSDGAA